MSSTNFHLKNVIIMSTGFLFNQFAFFSQGLIEEATIHKISETENINKHAGYISLAIIYASFAIGNLFSAPVVNILSTRWSMVIGSLCYVIYMAGFIFLNESFLYFSSCLLGVGATWLWVGQGKYLSINSDKESAGKHSAIFFTIYQANLTLGGIFLFVMYKLLNNPDEMNLSTIKLLYGIFTGVAAIASVIFLLLPTTKNDLEQKEASEPSNLEIMKLTTKLFFTKKSILISIGSAHSGIMLCFWSGIFPTVVAFTQKLGDGFEKSTIIALTVLFTGLGQLSGGIILTILNLKFRSCKREIIVTTSTIFQLIAYSIVFFTFPAIASLDKTDEIGFISPSIILTLVVAFLLGFSDGWLKSPLFSYILTVFPDKCIEAFAIFQFCQALLACAAFVYGTMLTLYGHIIILIIGSVSACLCFILAEILYKKETGKFVVYEIKPELTLNKKNNIY